MIGFLTSKLAFGRIWRMSSEPLPETTKDTEETTADQTGQNPISELRDLRPEKDPIGAGRPRTAPSSTARRPR